MHLASSSFSRVSVFLTIKPASKIGQMLPLKLNQLHVTFDVFILPTQSFWNKTKGHNKTKGSFDFISAAFALNLFIQYQ
jgi:hypothetical protein